MRLAAEAGLHRVLLRRFALIQRDCLAERLEVSFTKCKKKFQDDNLIDRTNSERKYLRIKLRKLPDDVPKQVSVLFARKRLHSVNHRHREGLSAKRRRPSTDDVEFQRNFAPVFYARLNHQKCKKNAKEQGSFLRIWWRRAERQARGWWWAEPDDPK